MDVKYFGAFIALLAVSCASAYPEGSYFDQVKITNLSQSRGSITFNIEDQWRNWIEKEHIDVRQYGILSPSGGCSGRISGTWTLYRIETQPNVKVYFESNNGLVECTFPKEGNWEFLLFPIIPHRRTFEDGNIVGETSFSISVGTPIQ